ncbi:MAG: phage/plasmid primase, P4 family, partial [Natronomonas sp.]|uniref:phage/plasmid primase, P4 family n=1 Tax=Natronomonas sp. TaxID=2184060 RepID=UPI0028709ADF
MTQEAVIVEPSGREFYPEGLLERNWWINWVLAYRYDALDDGEPDEDAVATKQPVAPYLNGDATPSRWGRDMPADEYPATAFDEVEPWVGARIGVDVEAPDRVISDEVGIGIIKESVREYDGEPVTLLDWDDVRDPDTGEVHPVCAAALDAVDAYAEISQSGEGIHQFVYGKVPTMLQFLRHIDDEPFVGDDLPMIEMYSGKRVCAMTGTHVAGTGDDLVAGQDLIDQLCWKFGRGTNNNEGTATDPFAAERDGETEGSENVSQTGGGSAKVPSHEEVEAAMRETLEYSGDSPAEWDSETLAEIKYEALIRGRENSDELVNVSNWQLYGLAAVAGYNIGKEKAEIVADIVSVAERDDDISIDERRVKREVSREYGKAVDGYAPPPSIQTLKEKSLLPVEYTHVSELHSDELAPPVEKWSTWSEARLSGELDESSIIPAGALRHIAEEKGYYDFDSLETQPDELPAKAHNKALYWVNNGWAEDRDEIGDDEQATARSYKSRDAVVHNWQDVRYIYEDSKDAGRKAARDLLSSKYEFMTVSDSETLQLYDEDAGIYTDKIGPVRGEIYEKLGEHWSTHELNEITAGLRQVNVVEPRHLDAGDRDEALICVSNGVLDIFNRELHAHSPKYHFVNRVPVEYDPDADTSVFEEFVGGLVGRDADADTLFEMVGHALLPDANERYKKFLILTGDADNGKSMFYDSVSTLLNGPEGDESNTSGVKLAKLAQNRFSIYSMYGSLANIAGEIDGKKIRNTANLKDITGGDEVEIEPKGQDSFFDTLGTTLMFAANDPPILGERDKKAIATRIVPIELPFTFVENPTGEFEKERVPEDELKTRLRADEALSGLLNLALDGLERLEANNGDVSLPESPSERLEKYERSADPMREFGTIALENDADDYVVKADVTTLYKHFAQQQGYEIGSQIGPVLHGVLRGIESLNYTDSKPRHPDYSDTSLPLKGWDERKEVVDRVTLTEEGMQLAEAAGLIDEDVDKPESGENGPKPSLSELDAGYVTFNATAKSVLDPKPWLQGEGTFEGEAGDIVDYQIRDGEAEAPILDEGERYRIKNARITTDEAGATIVEIRPGTTEVNPQTKPTSINDHDGNDESDNEDDEVEDTEADPSATDDVTDDESGRESDEG